MVTDLSTQEFLRRNGMIEERARRAGRSLDKTERSIIMAARERAIREGANRHTINSQEMDGERDFAQVLAPVRVKAVFSYWEDAGSPENAKQLDIKPEPVWVIRYSNHPGLVVGGHVGAEQFIKAGFKPPKFMSYEKWIKKGRPVVRK